MRHRRALLVHLSLLVVLLGDARAASAQLLPIVAGTAGGIAAGGWSTLAAFVARSRMGEYVFEMDAILDVRLETLPILVMPIAGGVMGAASVDVLRQVGVGGGIGFVAGGAVGIVIGHVAANTSEARWAGGIIGSAAGLVLGALLGGYRGARDDPAGPEPPLGASISIPVP